MPEETWWLSFVDPHRPPGSRFLGVCVIDLSDDEVALALAQQPLPPTALPGADRLAGALWKAWEMGCNPGGEVQASQVSPDCPVTRNHLHQKANLREWGYR